MRQKYLKRMFFGQREQYLTQKNFLNRKLPFSTFVCESMLCDIANRQTKNLLHKICNINIIITNKSFHAYKWKSKN